MINGLMKDKLDGKITTEYALLRPRTNSCLIDDGSSDKKTKGTKTCFIDRIRKFIGCKNGLLNNATILKSQQRFKTKTHTEENNKNSISSNDDKRYRHLIKLLHFHMTQMLEKYRKQNSCSI